MLRSYIEHGLTPDPAGGVKLKTPGMQEALTFASETRLSNEVWELLERIDDRVALRWMMPGDQNALSHPYADHSLARFSRPTGSHLSGLISAGSATRTRRGSRCGGGRRMHLMCECRLGIWSVISWLLSTCMPEGCKT